MSGNGAMPLAVQTSRPAEKGGKETISPNGKVEDIERTHTSAYVLIWGSRMTFCQQRPFCFNIQTRPTSARPIEKPIVAPIRALGI